MSAEALKLFPEVLDEVSSSTALTLQFGKQVRCGWMCVEGLVVGVDTGEVAIITEKDMGIVVLGRHPKAVWCICGLKTTAATGALDGSIRLWNTHTALLISALPGHSAWVRCLHFHPSTPVLYSGSDDHTVKVWSCSDFSEIQTLKGHQSDVVSLALTKDGKGLMSGSNDGTVRVWSTETGAETAVLKGHEREISCIALSPNGKYLISASQDMTIAVWQLPEAAQKALFTSHSDGIWCLAVSNDSSFFLSGSSDKTIRIFSLESLLETGCLTGHTKEINALALTSNGQFAVSGSGDSTLKVWDLSQRTEVVTLQGHSNWVYGVYMALDETRVYSCSRDCSVRVWSFDDLRESGEIMRHAGEVVCLEMAARGKYLVSADTEGVIKVWDGEKRAEIGEMKGHSGLITCLEVSQTGEIIVTGSEDCSVRLWSTADLQEKHTFTGHSLGITCLVLSPDSKYAVSGSNDKSMRIWHLATLASSLPCTGHIEPISCLSLLPESRRVLSGSLDTSIKLWNLDTLQVISTFFNRSAAIRHLCVLNDEKTFVSSDSRPTATVWSIDEEKPIGELKGHLAEISTLFRTPNGKLIITGSDDYSIRVWNSASLQLVATLTGHLKEIRALQASFDSQMLLSGSPDGMVIIWCLRSLRELARFQAVGVKLVAPSPFGNYCASAQQSNRVHYFKLTYKVPYLRPCLAFPFATNLSVPGTNSFFGASIPQLRLGKGVNPLTATGLVAPYSFNALHICAYFNHASALDSFLKADVQIIRGAFGSFFTIALGRNTRKCIDVGLKYLISICEEEKGWAAVQEITQDIPGLVATNSLLLPGFFEAVFRPSLQTDLNHFIFPKAPPPLIVLNPTWYVSMDKYESSAAADQHEEVEVLVSDIKWNWALGSRESLQLLTALEGCLDRKVLTTPLITTVITWKWQHLMPVTLALTAFYCSLLVAMVFLIFDYGPLKWTQNVFLALNAFLLLYEGTQSLVNGYEYWQDPWNYLDWVRSTLCLLWIYCFRRHQYVELCVVCMCFLRGFTYFRTFKMTRMYVRLTLEVVKEMYSFLVVFAYAIIAFGMMYAVLVPVHISSAFEAWMTAYELLMGTYSTEGYGSLQWLCFTSASLVNVIIMLNLLISILGDAYEHSHTYARENDALEMIRIVIEYESMLFWRRDEGIPMVPTLCRVAEGQGNTEEWEGKIHQITKRIKDELVQNEHYMTTRSAQVKSAIVTLESQVQTVDTALKKVQSKAQVSDRSVKALNHLLENTTSSLDSRLLFAESSLSRLHNKLDFLLQAAITTP